MSLRDRILTTLKVFSHRIDSLNYSYVVEEMADQITQNVELWNTRLPESDERSETRPQPEQNTGEWISVEDRLPESKSEES